MRFNKYWNKKVEIDWIKFDSKKEAKRWGELKIMQTAWKIARLDTQPKYLLQEWYRDKEWVKIREINYIADFSYYDILNDRKVVEDVKASKFMLTEAFKIKWKIVQYKYPELYFVTVY